MKKLHPAVKWVFFIQHIFLFIFLVPIVLVPLSILIVSVAYFSVTKGFSLIPLTSVLILLSVILVPVLSYIVAILAYNNWSYEFRKDGIHLHRGIIWKHYSSIPYERIQNVDIHRGVIARMLGLSSLVIHTAGYSGAVGAEGRIPGLSEKNAEHYREWLLKIIRKGKQGL